MIEEPPVCPKSGLLRSRCRCKDPACYGRSNSGMRRRTSRHQRQRQAKRSALRKQTLQNQQDWMQSMWKAHAREHPEMWSEGYGQT